MPIEKKIKVFLTGGDGLGWAIDEDIRLSAMALEGIVDLVDLDESEVVHMAWWEGLNLLPWEKIQRKWIVSHVPGEPFRYFTLMPHRYAVPLISTWISRNSQAKRQLESVGIKSQLAPYVIDTNVFKPVLRNDPAIVRLRNEYGLPSDSYLIGSFQRDSEGHDLSAPKLVKGPDIFLEILTKLKHRGLNFHAVLAGPRRHWLIKRLRERNIPFTYVGQELETDDLRVNALSRETLNLLYNMLDLYLVTSRSEGGPHAILEAGASGRKVISSRVGLASETLEPECLFDHPIEAVDIIASDITNDTLTHVVPGFHERVVDKHSPLSVAPYFERIYSQIGAALSSNEKPVELSTRAPKSVRFFRNKVGKTQSKSKFTICLWHSFFKPPYGGGNQFMLALKKGLIKLGVDVRENELDESIDAYVLNSIHFDVDQFLKFSKNHRLNIVHRIDGPIHLIRGYDREKDELCFDLNQKFASVTVLQSAWTYQRITEMGYKPVYPVIIHNAVDSDIFYPSATERFDRKNRVKLISTSWSDNPRKGGPIYRWIDKNLDWGRFDYTFVGNVSEQFERIKHIPPVPSEELADILRSHDIYITGSRNDPCSNALIEALSCGLPAIYYEDGGHPELVSTGGLPFRTEAEILEQLDTISDNYQFFRNMITVSRLEDVAGKYLSIAKEIAS
ncbi:MAG: glycosyltransferase [Deltaproteobacteria bacterium]|nr:glycosyltransferase [Deltaproteobacteria bacterium]